MDELTILGPTEGLPGTLLRFQAAGVRPGAGLSWRVELGGAYDRATTPAERFEAVCQPGVFVLRLAEVTLTPGGVEIREASIQFQVAGGLPPDGGG